MLKCITILVMIVIYIYQASIYGENEGFWELLEGIQEVEVWKSHGGNITIRIKSFNA